MVDDVSNVTQTFVCPHSLLIEKMKYFRYSVTGDVSFLYQLGVSRDVSLNSGLEEVDISVHCNISIFAWIMDWTKQKVLLFKIISINRFNSN